MAQAVIHTSKSHGETRHHGEDTHNFLTALGYGFSEIDDVLGIAETDPKGNWFFVDDEDPRHAVRLVRKTGRFEIAEFSE